MQSEGEAACVGLCSFQECVNVFVCVHTPEGPLQRYSLPKILLEQSRPHFGCTAMQCSSRLLT